jgi:hypothetical protein
VGGPYISHLWLDAVWERGGCWEGVSVADGVHGTSPSPRLWLLILMPPLAPTPSATIHPFFRASCPVHLNIDCLTKTLNTNKCTKGFFITCNTLIHVSTLLGHLQGELFAVVTLWLHFIVELLIVYCVAFLEARTLCGLRLHCSASRDNQQLNYKVQP